MAKLCDFAWHRVEAASSGLHLARTLPFACLQPPDDSSGAVVLEQTRELIERIGNTLGWLRRFGLPKTSWRNKCPYSRPRPEVLAKGLKYPPKKLEFETEEERRKYMREARKQAKFMFGSPPTYSFMIANLAFFALILWHDQGTI